MTNEPMTALAAWLLTYAAHSTLLLGVAFGLQRTVIRTAAARDLLWKLASFAALGTATIHTVVLSNAPKLEPLAGRWEIIAPAVLPPVAAAGLSEMVLPPASHAEDSRTAVATPKPTALAAHDEPTRSVQSPRPRPLPSWPVLLVLLWLGGASCAVWLLLRRYRRARRRFISRAPVTGELRSVLDRLAHCMGATRSVRLTVCEAILSPVALGRAEICLPAGLLPGLTPSQQQSMLAHELAHLERRDPQWLFAFAWLEACFFFQPLNRLARKQFQSCAEQLCDGWALAHTSEPLALAQCLAEVARWLRGERDPLPYPGMAESASPLLDRVQRVLSGVREPLVVRPRVRWSLCLALAGFACIAPGITGVTRAASVAAPPPAPQAPDLAGAVRRIGSGVLRFSFETRDGVCGTGEEKDGTRMFALQPTNEWRPAGIIDRMALYVWDRGVLMRNDVGTDGQWTTPCAPGDARIDLTVREGKVVALDLSVAGTAPRIVVQDLGRVEPRRATDFLLPLTRDSDFELANRALIASVMARGGVSRSDLRAIESDVRVAAPIRRAAELWSASFELGQQVQVSRRELTRVADLKLPFADRLAALAEATRAGLQTRELIAFYPRVPDRAMRVELIDWLAQREDDAVLQHLIRIVGDAVVWEEQQAALRALAASRDPQSRASAEAFLRKMPRVRDEVMDARVYNYTYGTPQSTLAQRIAAAPDGVLRVRYDARAEACGSGMDRDGAGMFALLPTDRWQPAAKPGVAAFYSFDRDDFTRLGLTPNSSWVSKCQNGPVQLLIDVRAGRVVNLRIVVGNPIEGTSIDTELGTVPGPEAAAFLIELAKQAGQTIASNAILAAVIAGGEPLLYPELIRIAADLSRPERVRQTALYWVALDPTPGAAEALKRNRASLPNQRDEDQTHAAPDQIAVDQQD